MYTLDQAQKNFSTGFFLKASLKPFLTGLLADAKQNKTCFSVVHSKAGQYKKMSDKFGNVFEDEIVKYIASTFHLTFPENQCHIFHFGADELIIIFPNKYSREILHIIKNCVYNMLHRPFLFKNKLYKITMSYGITDFPLIAQSEEDLLKKAEEAMDFSRRHGNNLITIAGQKKFPAWRMIFVILGIIGIFACATFFYSAFILKKSNWDRMFKSTLSKIKSVMAVPKTKLNIPKPSKLDKVILKNGAVLEGQIVTVNNDEIVIKLYLDEGEGLTTINKSETAEIKYGSQSP